MGSLAALGSSIWTYIFIGRAEGKLDGEMLLKGAIQVDKPLRTYMVELP
jgi:hypothetical protein